MGWQFFVYQQKVGKNVFVWKNVVVDTLFIFSLSYVLRTELKRKK